MKRSSKQKNEVFLSEEETKELQHALKVAKFKRIPLTLGNVFGQCEPILRKKLMEHFRFQLSSTFREMTVDDMREKEGKEDSR